MKREATLFAILVMTAACNAPREEPTAAEARPMEDVSDAEGGAELNSNAAASPRNPSDSTAAEAQPRLALDPEGLRWFLPPSGTARPIPFGTAKAEVLASLEPIRGKATEGTNEDCGAGPVQYAGWADGLSLVFKDGRFAGWGIDGRSQGAIRTADGIGIGTTRAELDDAVGPQLNVRRSSLGTEFTAGSYNGLFSGKEAGSTITNMWAGVNCVAR